MSTATVSYLSNNDPQSIAKVISDLPRWMWLSGTSRTSKGPQLEGRLKDELGYITDSCIRHSADVDMSPWREDIINATLEAVFNEDDLTTNERVRFKPTKSISADPRIEQTCMSVICIFLALEQRLGLVSLVGTCDRLIVTNLSDEQVVGMLGFNAYLVYINHPSNRGTEIFSKAPIRRYGFCNHFEYMVSFLNRLVSSEHPSCVAWSGAKILKGTEESRLAGILWMRKLHTHFLVLYWEKVLGNHLAQFTLLPIHLQECAYEAVFGWLSGKLDNETDVNVGDVHEMIDLIERRLCNWDLN